MVRAFIGIAAAYSIVPLPADVKVVYVPAGKVLTVVLMVPVVL